MFIPAVDPARVAYVYSFEQTHEGCTVFRQQNALKFMQGFGASDDSIGNYS